MGCMNSSTRISPTVAGLRFVVSMVASSVAVVVEIDTFCLASAAVPPEDQPPLAVDADRVEPCQIAAQLLEVIAGRRPQVLISRRVVNHLELAEEPAFEVGRNVPRPRVLDEEGPQPLVPKSHDHPAAPFVYLCTTHRYNTQRLRPMPQRMA